jgi:carbamoyltransferase
VSVPRAVIGLCAFTHDSSAALFVDGDLVGFVEEERLSGEKHTSAYPERAVGWLLATAGLTADDVTHVAYNFSTPRFLGALPAVLKHLADHRTRRRALPRARSFARVYSRHRARERDLAGRFPDATVTTVDHHRAHGLYALASSGYADAAVLVVDSLGETCTTSIAHVTSDGRGTAYRVRRAVSDPASLGYAYGAVTEHLGWRRGDEEGTVMALAAHGDPARFRVVLAQAITLRPDGFALDPGLFALRVLASGHPRLSPAFVAATCPLRGPADAVAQVHADLAAALQERTEQVLAHLARLAGRVTGARRLCLTGGVAANCVAAGRIAEAGWFDEIHVPPAPGDSGTAIGAAVAVHHLRTRTLPTGVTGRVYLGPAYPDAHRRAEARGDAVHVRRLARPAHEVAEHLARGHVVGVFRGRAEAGPRALGNRSILASPLQRDVTERLNAAVKYREPFRPFAPVVLAERAADYVRLSQASPYMSLAVPVTALARDRIPAIAHANGTARVQTVTRDANPFLARVLEEFDELTGVPVLINTSLNVKGAPMAGTPDMALDTLLTSRLDALLLGETWVTRR